jgi:hypothetical protein
LRNEKSAFPIAAKPWFGLSFSAKVTTWEIAIPRMNCSKEMRIPAYGGRMK